GVAPREQGSPGGGANGLCHMEIGKLYPFCGHSVEVGRLDVGGSEYADILVTLVIGKDDDNIGFLLCSRSLCIDENGKQASDGQQQGTYGWYGHIIVVLTESYWNSTA